MKIDQVILENFGMYARKVLDFHSAPLVLIYGPNESGKTTALNGLRQALFGFKPRTPYLTNRQMAASVRGRMADGRILEFSRRKGRQDDLQGTIAGRAVPAEDIQDLLCNLDLASYEHLFGFSLTELRDGEAALKSARLSEALAGGGLGGMTALQQLRNELQVTLDTLYKPRGSTQRINLKLLEIKKSAEALRTSQVLPAQAEEMQRQLVELQCNSENTRKRYADAFQAKLSAERVQLALPKYRQRRGLLRQLAEMDLPTGIDMNFVAQWSDYIQQRKELLTRLERERSQLDDEAQQLEQLGGEQTVLALETEIEALGHQADEITAMRTRLKELAAVASDSHSICSGLLETLELKRITQQLMDFSLSLPKRKELEALSQEHAALAGEIIATTARLEVAQDSLQASTQATDSAETIPENIGEISSLLAQLKVAEKELAQRAGELAQQTDDPNWQRLCKSLMQPLRGAQPELSADWPVPSRHQIQQHQRAGDELQRQFTQASRQVERIDKELANLVEQLQAGQRGQADTLLAQAAVNSKAKNELISQWLDDLSQPLIATSLTPTEQRQRLLKLQTLLQTGEDIQSELLAVADSLAEYNQRIRSQQALELERTQAQQSLAECSRRQAEWAEQWQALWAEFPMPPGPVDVMLDWLEAYEKWRELAAQQMHTKRRLHIDRGVVKVLRANLLDCWPKNMRDDVALEQLLAQAEQWELAARDAARDRQQIQAAAHKVQTLGKRLQELVDRQHAIQARYDAWLSQVPIEIAWPLEQVVNLLDTIEQLRREATAVGRAETQSASLQKQLDHYESRLNSLARHLGRDVADAAPEVYGRRWLAELQLLREQRTRRIQLSTSIEHRTKRIAELESRQLQLDSRLAALCSVSGEGDPAATGSLVDRFRAADELRQQITELSMSIESYCATQEMSEFETQLENADEAQLHLRIDDLDRELKSLDEQRKLNDQLFGSLTEKLERIANNGAAQRNQQLLQDQRWDLAELSEQWIVQRLAEQLLSRSIQRFADEHEPVLLQIIRDYLMKLTQGRYTGVEHDNARPGGFVVVNPKHESFTPEQLSTGTREQLYLAIRMAFITHHCEYHEPLPVIMDDCFVNFDDARTTHALQAIANWDDTIQTIVLSCHGRVVQALAEIAPTTTVIHLERDEVTTAGELACALV